MKMTVEEADELVSLVCDKLCHYPFVCAEQEDLDERCESCSLVERLLKEVKT